jgi:glycosyltransferase involved in cell wall biosynthesis
MAGVRVAYTLEQCWHRVPGGTAVAALEMARRLVDDADVELVGVAGRHRHPPAPEWVPPVPVRSLPLAGPWLYEAWLRAGHPRVERATGPVDVAHATTIIPCPSAAPLVVTVHDLAFRHEPEHFTRHGVRVFEASLRRIRQWAALVLCSSQATLNDCRVEGLPVERLRLVPLGVHASPATPDAVVATRARLGLPAEYLVFVGTLEPRKNLARLVQALQRLPDTPPLVVVGPDGWGAAPPSGAPGRVIFTGPLPADERDAVVAGAAVLAYPSLREGFGLPVLEAMAQGTPVVTSRGTATEEAAGGAAVLVDPRDVDDIGRGIAEALADPAPWVAAGRKRAAAMTWERTAELTLSAYREVAV